MTLSTDLRPALRSVAVLLTVALSGSCLADRLLVFAARERAEGDINIAEVMGGGRVIIRLRSKSEAVFARAHKAVEALRAAAVAQLAAPDLAIDMAPDNQRVLKARGQAIVTADNGTAEIASTTPAALAASWLATVGSVFKEPYLAISTDGATLVPVGEARYVSFGGPLGKALAAVPANPEVALVKVELAQRSVKIYGASPGSTAVTLSSGSTKFSLNVDVKHWAAKIAPSAVAELTGSGQNESLAKKVAINAALSAAVPRPGALLSVSSAERHESTFRIGVRARGEAYIDAKRQVSVTLKWAAPPNVEPVDLMVSNSPERIHSPGGLMRERLIPDRPARLLYHHLNSSGQRILFVVKIANAGREPAAAHIILAEAGPGGDELGVGHAAAKRFWEQRRTGSGYVLRIPAMSASDIVRVPASPGAIVSGLVRIAPLSPAPLFLEVAALPLHRASANVWVEPLNPEHYAQPKMTTFRFPAKKVADLTHEIGGKWTFFGIGLDGSTNEAGTHLAGDYGVLHVINLEITNPNTKPGWAELAVRASAGLMRGLFLINGVLHETGILRGGRQESLLRREIPPGGSARVRIETIPESASNYPVRLVVHSQVRE